MTHDERNARILEAIAKYTEAATQSRKAARDALISEGIYTRKGRLKSAYGGKTSTKLAKREAETQSA
jgi:hypothetical protein